MARKCSSCGNNGHNSRTCGGHSRTAAAFENNGDGQRGLSTTPRCLRTACPCSCRGARRQWVARRRRRAWRWRWRGRNTSTLRLRP
ncbi:Putative MYB DNA-binding domain superfamily protein [Zea mays]|uniref:Putative MYB DNA-binding domain superfamily protein n=1 Tax=Zea mays TaxID=4577 RepID=A0A1D6FFP8_MAIZE|nr:Putative MYB DNA-binding domain superfamily protein [Zea mays]